jgi:hypothetical protein
MVSDSACRFAAKSLHHPHYSEGGDQADQVCEQVASVVEDERALLVEQLK